MQARQSKATTFFVDLCFMVVPHKKTSTNFLRMTTVQ